MSLKSLKSLKGLKGLNDLNGLNGLQGLKCLVFGIWYLTFKLGSMITLNKSQSLKLKMSFRKTIRTDPSQSVLCLHRQGVRLFLRNAGNRKIRGILIKVKDVPL